MCVPQAVGVWDFGFWWAPLIGAGSLGAGAPRARRDFSWQVERAQDAFKMLYDRMTVSAPRALCAAGVFVACGLGAVVEL